MKRRVMSSMVCVLVALGGIAPGMAEQGRAPRGELRIVDKHPQNFAWITFNVFEHLMELDKDGTLVPRLTTSWEWRNDRTLDVTLRQGVTFHNGEVFDAEIVKLNWEENTRQSQPHLSGVFMSFPAGSTVEVLTPQTVRFRFSEPDGGALAKLSIMHIANRQFYRDVGWGERHW